jgi:hypothetical protein
MAATISKKILPQGSIYSPDCVQQTNKIKTGFSEEDSRQNNVVIGKDIEGNEKKLSRSNPYQLTLFQYFIPQDNNKYSNSIELYDVAPKYFTSSIALTSLRRDTEFGSYLPTLERKFCHRGQSYSIEITPGSIKKPLREGIMYTMNRYPLEREQLVEEALRKIACDKKNGVYLDNKAGVQFNLKHLQKELKTRGHTINYPDLIESLIICHTTNIAIKSADAKGIVSSTLFPVLLFSSRKDWIADPQNAKFYVQFNPLVTESIRTLSYRQFDYELFMKLRSPLTRWFYKRLSHHFINAASDLGYTILANTIIRDSGLVNCNRFPDSLRQIKNALEELVKYRAIVKVNTENRYDGKKIVDCKYDITMAYRGFVEEMKKANKRRNELIDIAREDGKLKDIPHHSQVMYSVLD